VDTEISDSVIREQTEQLIELLREHHPEQECEPEGLRIKEDPPAPKPQPVAAAIEQEAEEPEPLPYKPFVTGSTVLRRVVNEVAAEHELDPDWLMSKDRSLELVLARREIYVRLRRLKWGWSRIARSVGRDHSTIRHNIVRYEAGARAL